MRVPAIEVGDEREGTRSHYLEDEVVVAEWRALSIGVLWFPDHKAADDSEGADPLKLAKASSSTACCTLASSISTILPSRSGEHGVPAMATRASKLATRQSRRPSVGATLATRDDHGIAAIQSATLLSSRLENGRSIGQVSVPVVLFRDHTPRRRKTCESRLGRRATRRMS
jgi:hypothetical protein